MEQWRLQESAWNLEFAGLRPPLWVPEQNRVLFCGHWRVNLVQISLREIIKVRLVQFKGKKKSRVLQKLCLGANLTARQATLHLTTAATRSLSSLCRQYLLIGRSPIYTGTSTGCNSILTSPTVGMRKCCKRCEVLTAQKTKPTLKPITQTRPWLRSRFFLVSLIFISDWKVDNLATRALNVMRTVTELLFFYVGLFWWVFKYVLDKAATCDQQTKTDVSRWHQTAARSGCEFRFKFVLVQVNNTAVTKCSEWIKWIMSAFY